MREFIFLGPTLHRGLAANLELELGDFVVMPPVKRGDVQRLVATNRPGLIAIVDGYFHLHQLAVGHAELRQALEAGWIIWGLSSMGAIRAAEMRELGMRGFGRVYERYANDPTFRDDEVALLHEPGPPYRTFSEPLVHIRAGLEELVTERALTEEARDAVLASLVPMWFGDRTLAQVARLLEPVVAPAPLASWQRSFDRFQVKSLDLKEFLVSHSMGKLAAD